MDYKLAKQLKEVGFPQEGVVTYDDTNQDVYKEPTLSELIEACGDEFVSLERGYIKNDLYFEARGYELVGKGKISLIAVAKLYIELNK